MQNFPESKLSINFHVVSGLRKVPRHFIFKAKQRKLGVGIGCQRGLDCRDTKCFSHSVKSTDIKCVSQRTPLTGYISIRRLTKHADNQIYLKWNTNTKYVFVARVSDQQYSKIQTQQSYHVKSLFEEEEQIEYVLKLFVYNTQCNTKTKWAVLAGH